MIKSSELTFKPVKDYSGKFKTGTVGPWACEMYECTGDMQLQAFRKGAGDNLLSGLSMTVRMTFTGPGGLVYLTAGLTAVLKAPILDAAKL